MRGGHKPRAINPGGSVKVQQLAWSLSQDARGGPRSRPTYGALLRAGGAQQPRESLDERVVTEIRLVAEINPRPIGLRNRRFGRLLRSIRDDLGASGPDGTWIGRGGSSSELAMTVVDPDPDWGKRPSAQDDKIQVPVTVHIAGQKPHSAFLGANAERTRAGARGELELNSISEPFRIPTLYPHGGEVGTAIPIQIGNKPALLPQQRYGLRGQGGGR
jgi:hypothetical protein